MRLPILIAVGLVAAAGCGSDASCPPLPSGMQSLASQAASIQLRIFDGTTSCDGNDVAASAPAPLVDQRIDKGGATLPLPPGRYVVVLHAFDDANAFIGSACAAELFTPGQQECLSLMLSAPTTDASVDDGPGGAGGMGGAGGIGGTGGTGGSTVDMGMTPFTTQTSGSANNLYQAWGAGGGEAFVVGVKGTLLHTTNRGSTWTTLSPGVTVDLQAVWGSSSSDLYVVGLGGTALHSSDDGASWTHLTLPVSPAINLYDVWGAGAGDVYIVGDKGQVMHGSASAGFTSVSIGSVSAAIESIWGSSTSDVYLFGGSGTILHGSASGGFTKQTLGTTDPLYFGWGSGSDVWINGVNSSSVGTIYHTSNHGSTWSSQFSTGALIWAIWATSGGDAFAVGDTILESTDHGATWNPQALAPAILYGVGGDPTGVDVWAVGVGGLIMHRAH